MQYRNRDVANGNLRIRRQLLVAPLHRVIEVYGNGYSKAIVPYTMMTLMVDCLLSLVMEDPYLVLTENICMQHLEGEYKHRGLHHYQPDLSGVSKKHDLMTELPEELYIPRTQNIIRLIAEILQESVIPTLQRLECKEASISWASEDRIEISVAYLTLAEPTPTEGQ